MGAHPDLHAQLDEANRRALAAEGERDAALAALERSLADLDQFAYVASHDLSEPLRTVASFVNLLKQRYEGRLDDDADEFIHYAVDGTQRMQGLIDDLLQWSRAGRIELELAEIDTAALVAQVVERLAEPLTAGGGEVVVEALPTVHADERQLGLVLANLIDNAVKFVAPGVAPRVVVSGSQSEHETVITVTDNGIGIPTDRVERVFKLFQRLHGREAYPGTGIGLPLAQRIVERHGGRVWVESVPAAGSAFAFALPRAAR